jgi:hypothetical protein
MSKEITYKNYNIKSHPNKLLNYESKFSPNGVIEYQDKGTLVHIPVGRLSVPQNEWICNLEHEADEVFIKYAKKFIDHNI